MQIQVEQVNVKTFKPVKIEIYLETEEELSQFRGELTDSYMGGNQGIYLPANYEIIKQRKMILDMINKLDEI